MCLTLLQMKLVPELSFRYNILIHSQNFRHLKPVM